MALPNLWTLARIVILRLIWRRMSSGGVTLTDRQRDRLGFRPVRLLREGKDS